MDINRLEIFMKMHLKPEDASFMIEEFKKISKEKHELLNEKLDRLYMIEDIIDNPEQFLLDILEECKQC